MCINSIIYHFTYQRTRYNSLKKYSPENIYMKKEIFCSLFLYFSAMLSLFYDNESLFLPIVDLFILHGASHFVCNASVQQIAVRDIL